MNSPELCEIRIAGHLGVSWRARFEGSSMRHQPEGETVLSITLHGVLMKIRDLGVKLISVKRVGSTGSS